MTFIDTSGCYYFFFFFFRSEDALDIPVLMKAVLLMIILVTKFIYVQSLREVTAFKATTEEDS